MSKRLTNEEMLFYWSLLDLSFEIEMSKYSPVFKDATFITALTDFLSIFETEDTTYIVSTGSNTGASIKSVVEWVSNLTAWPKRGFHRGFYTVARRMFKKLRAYPWDLNKKKVFICHSRGIYGLPLAYLLEEHGYIVNPEVVSFGAPECVKNRGIDKLEESGITHHRIYTPDDFIRHVGASKHWETFTYELPTVEGLDHIRYQEAIEKAMKIEKQLHSISSQD